MARFSIDILRDKYAQLPEDLRIAVTDLPAHDLLYEIADAHNLTNEQIATLSNETGYVILGLTPAREFITHLKNELKLDPATINTIAGEINEKIFSTLRERMRELHGDSHVAVEENQTNEQTHPRASNPAPVYSSPQTTTSESPVSAGIASSVTVPRPESLKPIHEQKLSGNISVPSVDKKEQSPEAPTVSTDPYREPV